MTRFYRTSVLLIEFDEGRAFGFQSAAALGEDIAANSIVSKLALLTLHFPTLRLMWMRSPHWTADMFDLLKQNQVRGSAHAGADQSSIRSGHAGSGLRMRSSNQV